MLSSSFSRKQKDATYVYGLPGATRTMKAAFTCSLESETKKTVEQGATWRWRLAVLRPKMVIRSCDVGAPGSFHPITDLLKVHGRYSMSGSARSAPI